MSENNNNNLSDEQREYRKKCAIADSDLCNWLDRKGCYHCYISTLKSDEDKKAAMERWETTLSYIPENIDDLHMGDDCVFCKQKPANKIDGYASFEMAHPEPYSAKGMFFGIGKKVRTPVGSLVTLQAGICDDCKKAFRKMDFLHLGIFFGFLAAAFVLLLIPGFAEPMANLFALLPVLFVALMALAGYFLGKQIGMNAIRKAAKTVHVDVAEIPLVRQMLGRGWFFFQLTNGMPRLYFKKTKTYTRLRKPCGDKDGEDDLPLDNMNI